MIFNEFVEIKMNKKQIKHNVHNEKGKMAQMKWTYFLARFHSIFLIQF